MGRWVQDIVDFLTDVVIPLIFIISLLGILLFGVGSFIDEKRCQSYGEITGKNIKYSRLNGCFLQIGDEWLTKVEYGKTIIAKEGISGLKEE